MGGPGSSKNVIGKVLLKECIKRTCAETLTCIAKFVKKHGFWIELHFAPQVIEISFSIMWQDVPVAILPFTELPNILGYFGSNIAARNGTDPKYRSHQILSNMTAADYNEESMEIVCKIYEMDVIMQRSLGMEVSRCDPFVPHKKHFL